MPTPETVVCQKCGLVDSYRIEVKANNHCAYCNPCNSFIKNIPYSDPTFFFGRYKGMKVSELEGKEDLSYLRWYLTNIDKITPAMKSAIQEQIKKLEK